MLTTVKGGGNTIRVKFQVRNIEGCGGCSPIVYVGTGKPASFADFAKVGNPLAKTWETYVYEKPVKGDSIVVAVGYMNSQGTLQWAGIDNVSISVIVR